MSVDQATEQTTELNVGKNASSGSTEITGNENRAKTQLASLKKTLSEAIANKNPSAVENLVLEIKQFLKDPQAFEAAQELIKENLDRKNQTAEAESSNPLILAAEQKDLEQLTDPKLHPEGEGEIKIDDVITSLASYRQALEEAGEIGLPTDELTQSANTSPEGVTNSNVSFDDDKRKAIIDNALKALKQDPMVATLIGLIGTEPAVVGSFINLLEIIKGRQEQTSDGKGEQRISVGQFLMLFFLLS